MTEIETLKQRIERLEQFIWRHSDQWDDAEDMIQQGSLTETVLDTIGDRVYISSPAISLDRP